jgi:hypothetical protein
VLLLLRVEVVFLRLLRRLLISHLFANATVHPLAAAVTAPSPSTAAAAAAPC